MSRLCGINGGGAGDSVDPDAVADVDVGFFPPCLSLGSCLYMHSPVSFLWQWPLWYQSRQPRFACRSVEVVGDCVICVDFVSVDRVCLLPPADVQFVSLVGVSFLAIKVSASFAILEHSNMFVLVDTIAQ